MFEPLELAALKDGRRCSGGGAGWLTVAAGVLLVAVDVVRGAAKVFLTFEKREVTRAYDEYSFSSSSANGLEVVRLVMSSLILPVRRALLDEGALLWPPYSRDESISTCFVHKNVIKFPKKS